MGILENKHENELWSKNFKNQITLNELERQTRIFNAKQFEIVYVDIYKKKLITSYRTKKDYDLLKKTVIGVVKCIQNDIQCISPDKNCYHCEYRKVCDL